MWGKVPGAAISLAAFALGAGLATQRAAGQDTAAFKPSIYEGAEAWQNPNGRTITEDQVFHHNRYTRDWQAHSYYLFVRLDDGTLLTMNLFQWKYGIIGNWGIYVLVDGPDGRVFTYDGQLPGSLKADATGMRVHAGASSFESSGGAHRWKVSVPGFSCDLTFMNVLPAWMPGDGVAYYTPGGDCYNRYALPAPWADVSGTLNVFGRSTTANGQCYYDTSESVFPLDRMDEEIVAFRTFSPAGTPRDDRWFVSLLRITSHPSFGPFALPFLLVAHGSEWVFTTQAFDFDVLQTASLPDPPYPYATAVAVAARQGGVTFRGTFVCERLFHVQDIFARLPPLFRMIASWFLKRPVSYRSEARFSGTVTLPDGSEHVLDLSGLGEDCLTR